MKAKRVKKDGGRIGEKWESDDDKYLILRLVETNGSPWLVAHHGIYEIVKAPLFVPAVSSSKNCTSVCIHLRDYANRGDSSCIRREFEFEFLSITEASSFVFAHNAFISAKNSKNESIMARSNVASSSAHGKELLPSQGSTTKGKKRSSSSLRKQQYKCLTSSSDEEGENTFLSSSMPHARGRKRSIIHKGRREKKKMKVLLSAEEDENQIDNKSKGYKEALSHFWIGNEENKLDDEFEHTPMPWGHNED